METGDVGILVSTNDIRQAGEEPVKVQYHGRVVVWKIPEEDLTPLTGIAEADDEWADVIPNDQKENWCII